MRWLLWVAVVGCGYSEAEFIPAKTDLFCDLLLECADDALLVFDGQDKSRCVSTYGPQFKLEQAQCKMVGKFAKQCLVDLESMTCPSDSGSTAADILGGLPAACNLARKKCFGGPPVDTDVSTDDTGS